MLSPPVGMQSILAHRTDDWETCVERAMKLVAEGKSDEILVEKATGRFPLIASAQTITHLWGENNWLEGSDFLAGHTIPLLITLGENDATREELKNNVDRIAAVWTGPVTQAMIPDAGHCYYENPKGLGDKLLAWLEPFSPLEKEDLLPDPFLYRGQYDLV